MGDREKTPLDDAWEMLNRLRLYNYRQDEVNLIMGLAYIHDGLQYAEAEIERLASVVASCDTRDEIGAEYDARIDG